ncbi:hypothetical protein BH10PSE5_BH10PSE5_22010 [soil metagenome]
MAQAASIFLATPCYGGLAHIHFMRSVLNLQAACAARGVGLTVELGGGDALITRARAAMADKFLKSGASHLLFVDADIGFKPEQVFRLLDADRDLVGGVYPIKSIDWGKVRQAVTEGKRDLMAASVGYVVRFIPTPDSRVEVDDDGFGPVAYIGTGFMLIKRAVVEQVAAAHPELKARLGDTLGGGGHGGRDDLRDLHRTGHRRASLRGLRLLPPLARPGRRGVRRLPDPADPCRPRGLCRQSDGRPGPLIVHVAPLMLRRES